MTRDRTMPRATAAAGVQSGTLARLAIWIALAAILLLLPYVFSSRLALSTMSLMGTMIIFALSYNMLLGPGWMLVVPRVRDRFEGVPINSIAFAGAFFVRNDTELEAVRALGPFSILDHVCN